MPYKYVPLDHHRILDLYSQGFTINEIVDDVGARNQASIWYVLRKHGIYPTEKKKLDCGKIKALVKAGWSNERIIEEFRYGFYQKEFPDAEIEAAITKVRANM